MKHVRRNVYGTRGWTTGDPSAHDNYAIRMAAVSGDVATVRRLLADPRVDPSDLNNEALVHAARNGHLEVVRLLLEDGRADPTAQGTLSVLDNAVAQNNVEMVELLLADPRVNPAAGENCALCTAAFNGSNDVMRVLLADGRVDPAASRSYAFILAARQGHADTVRILLDDGRADPAARKNTALMDAAYSFFDTKKVIRMLLNDPRVRSSPSFKDAVDYLMIVSSDKRDLPLIQYLHEELGVPLTDAAKRLYSEAVKRKRLKALGALAGARRGVGTAKGFGSIPLPPAGMPPEDRKAFQLAKMLQHRRVGRFRAAEGPPGMQLVEPYGADILGYLGAGKGKKYGRK